MKLKTVEIDGKVYAEVKDGQPVYDNDGTDATFDAPALHKQVRTLNAEAKSHREAKEEAEKALKAFEGIDDPKAAKKALETVANLNSKDLIDAGKADEVKAAAVAAVEEKYQNAIQAKDEEIAAVKQEAEGLAGTLNKELIGGNFARSKFISEKVAIPPDLVQARFGQNFKIEDGKVVAYDSSGNKIYSKSKPGEVAEFDEALNILVDQYPYRDDILKGQGKGGGGAHHSNGAGGEKTLTREAFDAMDHGARRKAIADGVKVVDAA